MPLLNIKTSIIITVCLLCVVIGMVIQGLYLTRDCDCPEVKQTQGSGLDFEKLKGKNVNLTVHQHYTVNADSLILAKAVKQSVTEAIDNKVKVKCR